MKNRWKNKSRIKT